MDSGYFFTNFICLLISSSNYNSDGNLAGLNIELFWFNGGLDQTIMFKLYSGWPPNLCSQPST